MDLGKHQQVGFLLTTAVELQVSDKLIVVIKGNNFFNSSLTRAAVLKG
jgi:hypothetical protein